jgi:hypothetical protein
VERHDGSLAILRWAEERAFLLTESAIETSADKRRLAPAG